MMSDTDEDFTPKEKLALSRGELLSAMGYQQRQRDDTQRGDVVIESLVVDSARAAEDTSRASFMGRWWRGHPASYALALLEPGLQRYARLRPGRLVAYAAGAGAALVVLRPWRLLSLGAIVALAFKATDVVGVVSAALDAPNRARNWTPPRAASVQEGAVHIENRLSEERMREARHD